MENPQDWAYQKTCEQNGAYKKDYANANMSPKQVTLSTIWGEFLQMILKKSRALAHAAVALYSGLGVVYFFGNLAYNGIQGGMLSDSFHRTMELLNGSA